jgi:hypothetical protein
LLEAFAGGVNPDRSNFKVLLSRLCAPCHLFSSFPLAAVADILGEGDEVMVEPVVSSFLTKKALMFLNSAARELFGRTLAPEASISIVW